MPDCFALPVAAPLFRRGRALPPEAQRSMRIPLCAPIDINHFAINVASSGRAKKDYNQSDIFRLPNRNLSSRPVLLVFFGRKHPLVDLFRMNDAGGDAVTVTPSLATTRDNDLDQMSVAPFGGIAAFKEI